MNIISTTVYDIDIAGRIIILILAVLSVIAWGIVIEKIALFIRLRRSSDRFLALFQTFNDWRKIEREAQELPSNPYLNLFRRLYEEFQSGNSSGEMINTTESEISKTDSALYRVIADTVINTELMPFEKRLVILSSTISASPFLGLFGTVWGVMQAFMSIGLKGSAALTAIGPGIAVALITTIAGLAVAIPILFAYNIIVDKIRKIENHLQVLSNEMIQKLLRGNIHGGTQA
jgi:biopolymer transport protein TolQ